MTYARPEWSRFFPERRWLSLSLIAVICGVAGPAALFLQESLFADYGLSLFIGFPFLMGFLAPLAHGMGAPRRFGGLFAASVVAQLALFSGVLLGGIEGVFCLLMAAPLWMTCAAVGSALAYPVHRAMWRSHRIERGFPVMSLAMFALLPAWMGAEHLESHANPLLTVQTSIVVDAPPEIVWERVVQFPDMKPPTQWMFRMGVARPVRAEIDGAGVGAMRYCIFTTGRAVEPVEVWDAPHVLEVAVTRTPPPMTELSPYPNLHPPHLDGYFESARARFELIPVDGRHTKIVGTSWYRNRMYPLSYWRLWSDAAIKDVQVSVLTHIKELAEKDVAAAKLTGK